MKSLSKSSFLLRAFYSTSLVILLLMPHLTWAQPYSAISSAARTARSGAGGGAGGGVLFETDDALLEANISRVSYDAEQNLFIARFKSGEQVAFSLSKYEIQELTYAAMHDENQSFEVSIDPVLNNAVDYYSPELKGLMIGTALYELDTEIARLVEGGYSIEQALGDRVQMPYEVALQLLNPTTGNPTYQRLVQHFSSFSHTWHSTTITIGMPTSDSTLALEVTTRPRPIFNSVVGHRLTPADSVILRSADLPYEPIVSYFQDHPRNLTTVLPNLERSLRYAQVFAILSAQKHQQGDNWKPPVKLPEEWQPLPRYEQPYYSSLYGSRWSQEGRMLAGTERLNTLWSTYRLTLNPEALNEEERIALFVNLAFAHYGDSYSYFDQEIDSPDLLFNLIDGIDFDNAPLGGWGHLGRFIIGVWAEDPTEKLVGHINGALRIADNTEPNNRLLTYYTLLTLESLYPVAQRTVLYSDNPGNAPVPAIIGGGLELGKRTPFESATNFYSYLDKHLDWAIRRQVQSDFMAIEEAIENLFTPEGEIKATFQEAQALMNQFDLYNFSHELERVNETSWRDQVLRASAKLELAIGLAAYENGNYIEARERARMIDSHATETSSGNFFDLNAQFSSWSSDLRSAPDTP